jgi:hypothetical protein
VEPNVRARDSDKRLRVHLSYLRNRRGVEDSSTLLNYNHFLVYHGNVLDGSFVKGEVGVREGYQWPPAV